RRGGRRRRDCLAGRLVVRLDENDRFALGAFRALPRLVRGEPHCMPARFAANDDRVHQKIPVFRFLYPIDSPKIRNSNLEIRRKFEIRIRKSSLDSDFGIRVSFEIRDSDFEFSATGYFLNSPFGKVYVASLGLATPSASARMLAIACGAMRSS